MIFNSVFRFIYSRSGVKVALGVTALIVLSSWYRDIKKE